MRLHHLEVSAFGPFAETQSIDLDELGEAGLFLISGPTGSGKTSLLDAVSFALFGQVPGVRSHKSLQSQHADPTAAPTVELEVTLRGRRLRVRRSPAFVRPGRKTPVQAAIVLDERIDGQWMHLTARLDEAGRILEDVLGMTADQFHRVVVLPQGDFAAFLHASNDERGDLLRRLFDVQTFVDVETWLAEERRRLESLARDGARDLDRLRQSLVRVLSTVPAGVVADGSRDDQAWSDIPIDELVGAVADVDEQVQQAALTALAESDRADAVHRAAERSLSQARAVARDHDRGTEAAARLAELDAGADAQRTRIDRLDLADRAARALAHQSALERAEARLRTARADADRADQATEGGLGACDDDGVAAWIAHLLEHDSTAEALTHEGQRWQQALHRLPGLAAEVEQAHERLHELTAARGSLADRRVTAVEAVDAARAAAGDVERLTSVARDVTALVDQRSELDELTARMLPAAEDLVRDARDRAQAARERQQALVQERLDDMAGELAEGLVAGEACSVCGSSEHPAPARRRSSVDDAAIEAAERAWRREEESVDAARQRLAEHTARAEQLTVALTDDARTLDVLVEEAQTLAVGLQQARAAAAALPRAEADLAEIDSEDARLVEQEAEATARLHRSETLHGAEAARGREAESAVARLLKDHGACPCQGTSDDAADVATDTDDTDAHDERLERALSSRAAHEAAVEQARLLQRARAALAQADVLVDEARAARDDALAAEQIDSVADARAAVLSRTARSGLAAEVAAHAEQRAAAVATLEDAAVARAMGAPRPEVDRLATELEQARARWQDAAAALTQVQHAAREVTQHHDEIARLVAAAAPLSERLDVVTELASLTAGRGEDNADGIALTTYVLAVRLERIVTLANERLSAMADGRYELVVDHGRSDRRSRGGLGLQVLDQWTGNPRSVTTLSGGETFMAALALALGTADAVRDETGGADLQTLFIDEGFGSLDDDALEQVMGVLDDLRTGGRAVGVISHVADMRQRIPAQVRVSKTSTGSSVTLVPDVDAA